MKLDKEIEPLPAGLDAARAPALVARAEVHRAHARASGAARAPGRARRSPCARRARGRRARRVLRHVRRRRRASARGTRSTASAAASRAAARTSTRRSRRSCRCCSDLEPVARNLSDPDTRLDRFFRSLGARRRGGRAGGRGAGGAVREPGHHVHRARQDRAALPPGDDHARARPREEVAIRDFPLQRPFIRNQTALFRELRPGVATLPHSAPILADAFEAGTRGAAEDDPDERGPGRRLRRARRLLGGPARARRASTSSRGCRSSLRPTLRFLTPAQTVCNYATLWFRNAASLLSDGDSNGNWQRFMIVSAPTERGTLVVGPEQRGRPVERAGQRPAGRRTTSTSTRIRTPRRPARRASARRATSATRAAGPCSRTRPATRARAPAARRAAAMRRGARRPLHAVPGGPDRAGPDRDRGLPRLLEGHAVHARRSSSRRRFENAPPIQRKPGRADRRRGRGQGLEGRAGRRRLAGGRR